MFEVLIVGGFVAFLGLVSFAFAQTVNTLMIWSAYFTIFGFVFGVPTGVVYHFVLGKFLQEREIPIKEWIWSPIRYHQILEKQELKRVRLWGTMGAGGFLIICCGILFLSVGAVKLLSAA